MEIQHTFGNIPTHDHPAMFSKQLFDTLVAELVGYKSVIDPFAGVGRIHALAEAAGVPFSLGVEIEREWANSKLFAEPSRYQIVGDSRVELAGLDRHNMRFDVALTSCTYGNRMADHHEAKDLCKFCAGAGCAKCKGTGLSRRNTYKHRLGRNLTPGNSGGMPFGEAYKDLHREVWFKTLAITKHVFTLNVKDFVRRGETVPVTQWHIDTVTELGWVLAHHHKIECPGNRNGANSENRIGYESVLVFEPRLRG